MHTTAQPAIRNVPLPRNEWRVVCSRSIHPSADGGDRPLVAAIAEGLAAVAVPFELAGVDPIGSHAELLLSTENYDAWIVQWSPGSELVELAHDGSTGAFAVVSGELTELTDCSGTIVTRTIGDGGSLWFGSGHRHTLVNRGDRPVTSVHVYSPPRQTQFFEVAA